MYIVLTRFATIVQVKCQTPVLIVILVTRQAAAEAEYEVSIFGGYEDENATSEDITDSLLMSMQVDITNNTTCWLQMLIKCYRRTRPGSAWWWRPRAG